MLKDGTPEQIYEERKLRYRLASTCLEEFKTSSNPGRAIYSAYSHLAQIPELDVNMAQIDNLMFAASGSFGEEVHATAVMLLERLEAMLQEPKLLGGA